MIAWTLALVLQLALAAPTPGGWSARYEISGSVDGVPATGGLLVYLPSGYSADATVRLPLLLALHGWKHSAEMFRDQGALAQWAERYRVVVAVPDMGTTIYETAMYPETRASKAWSQVPGTRWVGEVVLPYVREHFAVYTDRAHTGVIGYSTGGRGALLLAEAYPELVFAGSASGTFDLMRLEPKEGEYRIHEVVYGRRDRFAERWERDNVIAPARLEKLGGVRVYASHGSADKSVRPNQLDALRDALAGRPDVVATFVLEPRAVHDWSFWNSQWGPMFAAFDEVVKSAPTPTPTPTPAPAHAPTPTPAPTP